MTISRTTLCLVVALLAAAPLSCRPKAQHQVTAAGSTSVQPFMELLAESYNEKHPGMGVLVQGGGLTVGIQSVREGTAAIGMCSRELNDQEKDLTPIPIARDGIAIIVSPKNSVHNLTTQQARDIFAGKITDWAQVGGTGGKIWIVTREPGSGTRGAFQDLLMKDARISDGALVQDSNGSVREIIAGFPNGIGYVSSGLVNESVKAINLNGVPPTPDNVSNGTYSLVRPFLIVLNGKPSDAAQQFIDFVLSDEGQRMLEEEHLTRAKR